MKKLMGITLAFAWITGLNAANTDTNSVREEAQATIASFERTDPGMKKLFNRAAGYAVFPRIAKGGFIVGGGQGSGLVFEKGKVVGNTTVTQVTVGAQIGGQVFSEVIFFETPETLKRFKESRFEMNAQISAVAAAEGKSQNARYVDGVLVFTKAQTGLMAEATVGGQKFTFQPAGK